MNDTSMSSQVAGIAVPVYAAILMMKLAGKIDLAWWLLLIPIWVPIAVIALIFSVGVVLLLIEQTSGKNPFQ